MQRYKVSDASDNEYYVLAHSSLDAGSRAIELSHCNILDVEQVTWNVKKISTPQRFVPIKPKEKACGTRENHIVRKREKRSAPFAFIEDC